MKGDLIQGEVVWDECKCLASQLHVCGHCFGGEVHVDAVDENIGQRRQARWWLNRRDVNTGNCSLNEVGETKGWIGCLKGRQKIAISRGFAKFYSARRVFF